MRYVFKIHTGRLKKAKWDLQIGIPEAKKNGEVISLAESQMIRFIEEIAGIDRESAVQTITDLKRELKEVQKNPRSKAQKDEIQRIYAESNKLQFCPEYLCVVCDTPKDYRRACQGFKVNGVEYRRLLGTSGGVKQSIIIFASTHTRNGDPLLDELRRRIDNGRDFEKPYIPAKLSAYMGLTCSASTPVSWPNGVVVVPDCVTHFKDDYLLLEDNPAGGDPIETEVHGGDITLDASDGFGLMSPTLAQRWSSELSLTYTAAGFCVRNAFCKGMVFCFDFHRFADEIAHNNMITDVWGNQVNINDVELVLTESMLKLWDAYADYPAYEAQCRSNHYSFAITKATPEVLDHHRWLNYQFIQSYRLDDNDIEELIAPTVNEIKAVMNEDVNAALLYLRGKDVTERNARLEPYDFVSALMVDERLYDDPYVQSRIHNLIKKRINDAKFGRLAVHGTYSILSGDPYALCQSMWGLEVTGLLKAGEVYNRYWADRNVSDAVCFRAPMSAAANVRRVNIPKSDMLDDWYRYMPTVTILNAWDLIQMSLNGADFDGDQVMITDNSILVNKHVRLPAINCVQKKAAKKIPEEQDYIEADINGFGDAIGTITNRITTMYDIQAGFEPGSDEWNVLEYRISCGQKYQQENIDKIKGISAEPMPAAWYDRRAAAESGNSMDTRIVADRKPYFMTYRYPAERSKYVKFQKLAEQSCGIQFGVDLKGLAERRHEIADAEGFLENYERRNTVIDRGGTMNRICHAVEKALDSEKLLVTKNKFDYSIMKSGVPYPRQAHSAIYRLHHEYQAKLGDMTKVSKREHWSGARIAQSRDVMLSAFREAVDLAAPNKREQCDILLDICYKNAAGKNLVWDLCAEQIVMNLLEAHGGVFKYITRSESGNIVYSGERFVEAYKEDHIVRTIDE